MMRVGLILLALVVAPVAIALMSALLHGNPFLQKVLLDEGQSGWYPYSVQNAMWVVFFTGIAELAYRYLQIFRESRHLTFHYLPEDETTVLVRSMLPRIYKTVSMGKDVEHSFLPNLIRRILTAFQTTHSVENASAILNSSIELRSHDLDLSYSIIRYILWLIPSLGFIGTVIGIALALNYAGVPGHAQRPDLLTQLTQRLAVAFYTTLVALLMSAVLLLIMHVVQEKEERIVNRCGQYCLDNLINRLFKTED